MICVSWLTCIHLPTKIWSFSPLLFQQDKQKYHLVDKLSSSDTFVPLRGHRHFLYRPHPPGWFVPSCFFLWPLNSSARLRVFLKVDLFFFFLSCLFKGRLDGQSLYEMKFGSHIMAFSITADIIEVKRAAFPNHL